MSHHFRLLYSLLSIFILFSLVACGGGEEEDNSDNIITFTIGGSLVGLTTDSIVLQNNNGDDLSLSTDGDFTFTTAINDATAYAVTIKTQPTDQTCTVTNSNGTLSGTNITNVNVTCVTNTVPTYTVGGAISGLISDTVVLQNNSGDDLSLVSNDNFTFTTAINDTTDYNVSVKTQPAGQTCTVANGNGTLNGANITDVAISCVANSASVFTIGGTLNGLAAAATIVLQNNSGDDLSTNANGSFIFTTAINDAITYAVTVKTQPTGQVCTVANGNGTISSADVSNIDVTCVDVAAGTFTISGVLSGITGDTVVLQNNASDDLSLNTNGNFTFATAIDDTTAYAVTVKTQPAGQTCTVTSDSGTLSGANISNVAVNCVANAPLTYTIGGALSGLTAGTVILQNNSGDDLPLSSDGNFTFVTAINDTTAYVVTVKTQPVGQTCTVTSDSGTLSGANISNVAVNCAANAPITYTVGGTLSGLAASTVVLQNNASDNLSLSADGNFTFATAINDTNAYAVSIKTQPAGQTCTITNGSGTLSGANISNVAVNCAANAPLTYTIGGALSGLTAGTVILQNNSSDDLSLSGNGNFTFVTAINDTTAYAVTVKTQPAGQTCTVTSGSGTLSGANISNVAVSCVANAPTTHTIGGNLNGLVAGNSIKIQNNGADEINLVADGSFTFATAITDGNTYNVTISRMPADQPCNASQNSGTVNGADIGNVSINCDPQFSWTPTGSLTTERTQHTATLLNDGKVLVVGGDNASGFLASAELYDPASKTWSDAGSLTTARNNHTATLLTNGKVLIVGGNGGGAINSVELYDPTTNAWSVAANMTDVRMEHTAVLLSSGKVLVSGGFGAAGAGPLASAELYDPSTNTWAAAGNLATGRAQHTISLLPNGNILVVGGTDSTFNSLVSAELYDPSTNIWTAASNMAIARSKHAATLLPNGTLLITGGLDAFSFAGFDSTELYDPTTDTWSSSASMMFAHSFHNATLLPNGRVLVAGGYDGTNTISDVELYDPETNTWSVAASLLGSRQTHGAVLLQNGKVLVVGGWTGISQTNTAELY